MTDVSYVCMKRDGKQAGGWVAAVCTANMLYNMRDGTVCVCIRVRFANLRSEKS
jgi:hypothetical protein